MPSHLDVKGKEHADDLALQGRLQHPNNMLPLSQRRRVHEWDNLGLESMAEAEGPQVTSNVDSGGGGIRVRIEVKQRVVTWKCGTAQTVRSCSAQMSVTPDLGRNSDSDGFSTDVIETRRKRRRAGNQE